MKRYPYTFSGRRASQSYYELSSFINFLKSRGVKRYLEIGARDGDTFHEIMISLGEGSFGVAVDLAGGLWGKESTAENLKKAIFDLKLKNVECAVVFGDSTNEKTIDFIKEYGDFDAILIDGDHTYDGVSKDFNNYSSLAPIIGFHDIVGNNEYERVHFNKVEVPKFWNEIKDENSIEFIDKNSTMGIGIWLKK